MQKHQEKVNVSIRDAQSFYPKELPEFLDRFGEIACQIDIVKMVSPTNYASVCSEWTRLARAALVDGHTANAEDFATPNFVYDKGYLTKIVNLKPQFDLIVKEASEWTTKQRQDTSIAPQTEAILQLLEHRMTMYAHVFDLAEAMLAPSGSHVLGNIVTKIYGMPTPESVKLAEKHLADLANQKGEDITDNLSHVEIGKKLREIRIDACIAKEAIVWTAKRCGLDQTRLIQFSSDILSSIRVRDTSPDGAKVTIRKKYCTDGLRLLAAIERKVLCYWREAENVEALLPGFSGKTFGTFDQVLSRGHSSVHNHDFYLKYTGKTRRFERPEYVVAEKLAATDRLGFAETAATIYNLIRPTVKNNSNAVFKTWQACYHTFRGYNPKATREQFEYYAFTRDKVYFEGQLHAAILKGVGLEHLLDLGALDMVDLYILSTVFKVEPTDFKYPYPEGILDELADKIIAGDFIEV